MVKIRLVSDLRLMLVQDMHAFLSGDVYIKPCTGKDGDAPNNFSPFGGAKSILLKRLENSCLDRDVLGCGQAFRGRRRELWASTLLSGRVRIEDKSATRGGPLDIVPVLPTEVLCAE
jgi:hypothetical protein